MLNLNNFLNILVPLIILIILLILIFNNYNENFILPYGAKSRVPGITKLKYNKVNPEQILNNSIKSNNTNMSNTNMNNTNVDNIYRQKTGRQAYEVEYFVNKYDSNFGGLLGTQMGLC